MNKLFFLLICFAGLINCSNTSNGEEKRLKVISSAIRLIGNGDIDSLKTIIDTNHFFRLYSKERFYGTIKRAQSKIKLCKIPAESEYKINQPVEMRTEYTLQFCRTEKDSLAANSFDLVFTFLNGAESDLIAFIDLRDYSGINKRNNPPGQ